MISAETSTKSTTALPRSPSRCWNGPAAGARGERASRGGQRGPSSATGAGDRVQRVGDRGDDRGAERDEDGQHEGRRHHPHHDPAGDVAALAVVVPEPGAEGRQGGEQVRGDAHQVVPFLLPAAYCASETMLISPG